MDTSPDPNSILSGRNAAIATVIVMMVTSLKTLFPRAFASRWGKRLLPVLPLVLGVVAGQLGLLDLSMIAHPNHVTRIFQGLLVGTTASTMFKVGRDTLQIQPNATPSVVPDAPTAPTAPVATATVPATGGTATATVIVAAQEPPVEPPKDPAVPSDESDTEPSGDPPPAPTT